MLFALCFFLGTCNITNLGLSSNINKIYPDQAKMQYTASVNPKLILTKLHICKNYTVSTQHFTNIRTLCKDQDKNRKENDLSYNKNRF